MKSSQSLAALILIIFTFIGTSCKKDNEVSAITTKDLLSQYFVLQKSVGKPLALISFADDNGTTKFNYNGSGTLRTGIPVLTDVNAGTATLKIDIDGNGASVLEYKLSKAANGTISLLSTSYQGSTAPVISSDIYKVKDLAAFKFSGVSFSRSFSYNGISQTVKADFTPTTLTLLHTRDGNTVISNFSKNYYVINNNLAAKVDPDFIIIAHKNKDGSIGYIMDNGGLVTPF